MRVPRTRFPFSLLALLPLSAAAVPAQTPPGMVWSTYLGGTGSDAPAFALDVASNGEVVIAGSTQSSDFPMSTGAYQSTNAGGDDAVFARISADGTRLVWSSFLGGTGTDRIFDAVVDPCGAVTVCGMTDSPVFPATNGQRTKGGIDAFVARFLWDGSQMRLVWLTLLGTPGQDSASGLAVHPNGSVIVVGGTDSTAFPGTVGRLQPNSAGGWDLFVAVLDAGGGLQYATYLGGSGQEHPFPTAPGSVGASVELDGAGNPVVAGTSGSSDFPTTPGAFQPNSGGGLDMVLVRLDLGLRRRTYATYLGGSWDDRAPRLAIGPDGLVTLAGSTFSGNFPVTDGSKYGGACYRDGGDGSVSTLDLRKSGAAGLVWSTYLGGAGCDGCLGVAVDRGASVTVVGWTGSSTLKTTPGACQIGYGGGIWDGFVTRYGPPTNGTARQVYSTFLDGYGGGGAVSLGLDGLGNAVVAGWTTSINFPVSPGALQRTNGGNYTGFITKLTMLPVHGTTPGVSRYGTSTPACRYPIYQDVDALPLAGSTVTVAVRGAPPSVPGFLALAADFPAGIQLANVQVFLNLNPLVLVPVGPTDARGCLAFTGTIPNPRPPGPLATQWFFATTPTCPGTGVLSASEGLRWW